MTAPSFNKEIKELPGFAQLLLEQQKLYADALTGTSEARQRTNEMFVDINTKAIAAIIAIIGGTSIAVSFLMEKGGVVANGTPRMWALVLVWIAGMTIVLVCLLCRHVCCRHWLQKVKFYIARSKEQVCIMSENEEYLPRRMLLDEYDRMKELAKKSPTGSCDASIVPARESDLALPKLFATIYNWIASGSVALAGLATYIL